MSTHFSRHQLSFFRAISAAPHPLSWATEDSLRGSQQRSNQKYKRTGESTVNTNSESLEL
jgi:hypothetical protein